MNSTLKRRTSADCHFREPLRDVIDAAAALHQTVQVCVMRYVDVVSARELRAKLDGIVGEVNIAGNTSDEEMCDLLRKADAMLFELEDLIVSNKT